MYVIEKRTAVINPSSTLIAFKPRQVILAEKNQTLSSSSSDNKLALMALVEKSKTLTADDKAQLLHLVLRYLESNQFPKALKYLLKDAQIQGDSWKASSLALEDIYSKYLGNCNSVDTKSIDLEELDVVAAQEIVCKKDKKKADEKASDSEVDKLSKKQKKNNKSKITSETLDQDATQSEIKSGLTEDKLKIDNGEVDISETAKSKHKKKNKPNAEPIVEDKTLVDAKNNSENPLEESEVKPKEKKKKKGDKEKKSFVASDNGVGDTNEPLVEDQKLVDAKKNNENPLEESEVKPKEKKKKKGDKEKKSVVASDNGVEDTNESKKRKRLASDENESQPIEESVPGETKRRKIEGSAEPKTVNAFQRVKVEDVKFVDERLTDNSYWAKDGADIGYGAKAQEILGQVRGKDFRHEKTKKKRGSYRGGQIDLQSHSVKFNYSEEE